jgi:GT2 family glycosyltransferase
VTAPTITILVPTIGRMEFLPETRRALGLQTRTDFRVIVLDNASPEPARSFIDEWAREDRRVEIARVESRVPMFANFNRGMRAVNTPIVTFFHDDDVYRSRFLEVLVGALERHPDAAWSGSNYDFVDETGAIVEERRWLPRSEWWSDERFIRDLVSRGRNIVAMPGLVFRRDAFPAEGFDESLPIHFGDFTLLMRAAERRGFCAEAEAVVAIRKHSAQASNMRLSLSIPIRTRVLHEYVTELERRYPARTSLVAGLRKRIDRVHRVGVLMGWLSSSDAAERDACLVALGASAPDAALRTSLRLLDRSGLRPQRVGPRLNTVLRSVAARLRV